MKYNLCQRNNHNLPDGKCKLITVEITTKMILTILLCNCDVFYSVISEDFEILFKSPLKQSNYHMSYTLIPLPLDLTILQSIL